MHEASIGGGGERHVAGDAERKHDREREHDRTRASAIESAIESAIKSVVLPWRAVTMWKCVLAVPIA